MVPVTNSVKGLDQAVFLFQGKFEGEAGAFDDAVEMKIPIHSRFLPARSVKMGDFTEKIRIDPSLPEELKTMNLADVNRSDFQANLVLSMNQWSKITPGLKYLLRYPFGCVEQTSSGVIPLAALRGLAQSGVLPGITSDQVDRFLKQGVNRLLSMQTSSGGFGYWPGDMSPSWWGTMYAVSALTLASEGGLDVQEDRMDEAIGFLRTGLFNKGVTEGVETYAWTREYALYNLAVNKALTVQELEPYLRDYDSSSNQSKALLILAANKIGALPRAKIVEMATKLNPQVDPSRIDFRNSSYREMALCLLGTTEAKASQVVADSLAGQLLRGLKPDGIWSSTADTGWSLLALGKYFENQKAGKPKIALVKVRYGDNSPPLEVQVSDASAEIEINPSKLLKTGAIALESDAKHLITYTLSVTYPDVVNDPAKLSKGFTLRKHIQNLNGKDEIRVGDVVRATLDINLQDPTKARYGQGGFYYLALEDPVPAGLVPINPDLKTEGVEKKKSDGDEDSDYDFGRASQFTSDFSEFRDDGVRVFKNRAYAGGFRYAYLARAVAEGDFWMRGSRISLMYDPDVFGRTSGKMVKVLPLEK